MRPGRNGISDTSALLIALVRVAMGSQEPVSLSSADWPSLISLSRKQGVMLVMLDALLALYDRHEADAIAFFEEQEYKPFRFELFGARISDEKTYAHHEGVIGELASFYASHGIRMMLLKGYGLSLNYPVPSHRPCGDVDIWLFGDQEDGDKFLESEYGIVPKKSSHHTIFKFKGVEIENHITLFESDCHKSNRITDDCLMRMLEGDDAGLSTCHIGDAEVFLPGPDVNALFLLRHSSGHFATESIKVRHILDWITFVESCDGRIDWDLIYAEAGKANMDVFLSCQNLICRKYFGCLPEMFPVRSADESLSDRIIADILSPEFNMEIPPMSRFFKYCYVKTLRLFNNRWKYRISFDESLFSHFWGYSTNRIRSRFFKH